MTIISLILNGYLIGLFVGTVIGVLHFSFFFKKETGLSWKAQWRLWLKAMDEEVYITFKKILG